jgi:DNA-binding transcriptional ArsR family regulator
MKEVEVIGALAALAHPVRLKVFRALVVSGPHGLTPGVMQDGLGVPAATLSFHLKELAASGLVSHERASRNLVYRAEMAQINDVLGYLSQNCGGGTDAERQAGGPEPARAPAAAPRR